MGTWEPQSDTQKRTDNIPATPGETTYYSEPYYIGLLKNGELNTTEAIGEFEITNDEWIKDVSFNKSEDYDYYQLTYEVEENSDTSEREGYISITHNAANKTLKYIITQSANTTQEPTEPTPNEYVFQITKYSNNSDNKYSLQVCGKRPDLNPDNKVSFASISTNDINDSTLLSIDIKIALKATNDTSRPLEFNFIIICDGFEFDSSIDNPDPTGNKLVDIIHNGETKGNLNISNNESGGLGVHIIIFSNNQDPKTLALLSEDTISVDVLNKDITGKITIKNSTHNIKFKVTLGFGALQQ